MTHSVAYNPGQDRVEVSIHIRELGSDSLNAQDLAPEIVDGQLLRVQTVDESKVLLEVALPCKVLDETCRAKFKSKSGVLTVTAARDPASCAPTAQDTSAVDQSPPTPTNHPPAQTSGHDHGHAAADDAALFREFADEAYCMSLNLDQRSHATASTSMQQQRPATPTAGNSSEPQQQAEAGAVQVQPGSNDITAKIPSAEQSSQLAQTKNEAAPEPCKTRAAHQPAAISQERCSQASSRATPEGSSGMGSMPSMTPGPRSTVEEWPGPVEAVVGVNCSGLATGLSPTSTTKPSSTNSKKAKKLERRKASGLLEQVAHSLLTKQWAVCDHFIPEDVVDEVRKEVKRMEDHYTPGEIWVGKEADVGASIAVNDVRGDSVLWLDEQALAATAFVKDGVRRPCSFRTLQKVLQAIDKLVMEDLPAAGVKDLDNITQGGRTDAMMALYPGGGSRFARHIDNSANDGRRLTCVCYLNNGWKPEQGGAIRLFVEGKPPVDVFPDGGRIVLFWSKHVAHEVRPTYAPRHAFTLWYYDALEKAEALAAAKVGSVGAASVAAQQQAQQLIRDILAQDLITPSLEGCAMLQQRVKAMTTSALRIVAAVVGAETAGQFVEAVNIMRPEGLAMLRDELGRMGLQSHAPTV